jgi:hypothetical protein
MSAFRVMAVVAQMGFAAGHAARQLSRAGCDLADIDVPRAAGGARRRTGNRSTCLDYGDYLRCDLAAHETAAPAAPGGAAIAALAIAQERNAIFRITWHEGGAVRAVERRERRWAELPAPAAVAPAAGGEGAARAAIELDGGWLARLVVDDGRLWAELSEDGGGTWSPGRELARDCAHGVSPAAIATRTGLAAAYALADGTVRFWHGSVERLSDAAVVPAAQRLDAPPDEVHGAPAPRA